MLNKSVIRLDTIEDILFHNTRMDVVNEEIDFKELVEEATISLWKELIG
jgi:aryl carrier-like protein